MTQFAQRLHTMRRHRKLRLCQLAAAAQLSNPRQLRAYETGVQMPRLPQFARLCIALELSPVEVCVLLGLYGEDTT